MATYVMKMYYFSINLQPTTFVVYSKQVERLRGETPNYSFNRPRLLCDLSFLLARPQRPHRLDNHCPLSEYKLAVVPLTIELLISLDRLQHIRCRCSGNSEWCTACLSTSPDSVSIPVMREKSNTKRILLLPH